MGVKKRELTVEIWKDKMMEISDVVIGPGAMDYALMRMTKGDDVKDVVNDIYEMQMAHAWVDAGMQVYEFDEDFTKSILDEKWIDLLPDCIAMRPHDCFYMKLPCGKMNEGTIVSVVPTDSIIGFDIGLFPGADLEKGVYFGGDERFDKRVVVNTGKELLSLCAFAISRTFDLMIDDTPVDRYPPELVANGVAYLCSTNADIEPIYVPNKGIRRNNAKKRSAATWSEVGYRIGAELRAYKRYESTGTVKRHGKMRPHMRRAHWHHYWTGPRNGERNLVLKWVAPTIIGAGDRKIEHATSHKVGI